MNWHVVTAVLSGIFSVTAAIPYIRDILRGEKTKPNAVTWFLWTVLQVIALIAQFKAGASLSVVFVLFVTINTAIVTVLALSGYGYKKYGWIDLLCFILAIAAIIGWQVTGNPVLAIVLVVVADSFSSFPTVLKTYREPHSEQLTGWALITIAAILGVLSTDRLDMANLTMPVYDVVIDGAIFFFAYRGQKKK